MQFCLRLVTSSAYGQDTIR